MSAPLVLVVDDEALIRMTLADVLLDSGFDVLEAEDADQAEAVLRDHPSIAALITDVRMPGNKDGFQLARDVAAAKENVRIFVMSGHVGPADTTLPRDAVFMSKPFDFWNFARSVRAALANDS